MTQFLDKLSLKQPANGKGVMEVLWCSTLKRQIAQLNEANGYV